MPIEITEAIYPVDASAVVRLLPSRPQLLALGEPTHRENTLLEVRNELFLQLVEQQGYRRIAIESDCLRGLTVADYVLQETGSLDDVMARGFSHEFGADAGNRELISWMREYNDGRPPSDRLQFAGFDGPLEITGAASPREAVTALHDYLSAHLDAGRLTCTAEELDQLLGGDEAWTNPAVMTDPTQAVGQSGGAKELRLRVDDLVTLLSMQAPGLVAATSGADWDRACLYGRTAAGLLRYHFWMADSAPGRMERLLGLRAQMMADNLLALAEQGPTLVYAHNAHLQREESTMRMGDQALLRWWSAGALVGPRLGRQYGFLATALGTIRHQGVDTPPPDTLEGMLSALSADRCLLDPVQLATVLAETPAVPRESPWFGYAPIDPDQLARIDGIVFVQDVLPG